MLNLSHRGRGESNASKSKATAKLRAVFSTSSYRNAVRRAATESTYAEIDLSRAVEFALLQA